MKRDCDTLDDLLISWHRWAKGYAYVSDLHGSPMFNHCKSPRGWDSVQDIVEHEIDAPRMLTVNFLIFELPSVWCTAIQIHARNLATGKAVWTSARLPADITQRQIILREARDALTKKLVGACIL
jgi:hypothetical protein